jgi:hypothetical protein
VAAVTVGVGLGVTHLALYLADMDVVIPYLAVPQVFMTISALSRLFQVVAPF